MTKREAKLLKRMIDQTQFNALHADTEKEKHVWGIQHDALCILNAAFIDEHVVARQRAADKKAKRKKD